MLPAGKIKFNETAVTAIVSANRAHCRLVFLISSKLDVMYIFLKA